MLLTLQGCSPWLDARKSEAEVRRLCAIDGGVKVYETVPIRPSKFPTIIPDASLQLWQPKVGTIFGDYRYVEARGPGMQGHGRTIYRDTVTITRISDGKVMGDLVVYRNEGDEILQGIHCPENMTEQKLIDSVFRVSGDPAPANGVYPTCPGSEHPKTSIALQATWQPIAPPVESPLRLSSGIERDRGISCDNRTKIDSWYGVTGKNTVGLVGTRLLFEGPDGRRCQALAMEGARRVFCSDSGIEVKGLKGTSALIQKYSNRGELLNELVVHNVAPTSALELLNYRESDTEVTVDTAYPSHTGAIEHYRAVAAKPVAGGSQPVR
jgi:hypothetical protein